MQLKLASFILMLSPLFICAQPNDLPIYSVNAIGYENGIDRHYIPLTDRYPFYDLKQEPHVIDDSYLGHVLIENENYHVLSPKKRSLFLSRLNIDSTDFIFVYNLKKDTVFKLNVKDLPVVAFLTPYGTFQPIPESDYIIGFELIDGMTDGLPIEVKAHTNLVYIGPGSPFVTGALKQIKWKPTEVGNFPKVELTKWQERVYSWHTTRSCYFFETQDFAYYLKNLGSQDATGARHLVAVNKHTQVVELSKIYRDSEGTYLMPMLKTEEGYEYEGGQHTGPLLRFMPHVIFGFLGQSFGCRQIDLLSTEHEAINIRCDNRH